MRSVARYLASRFLGSLLSGATQIGSAAVQAARRRALPRNSSFSNSPFSDMAAELESATELLVIPNPDAIRTVGIIVNEACVKLTQISAEIAQQQSKEEIQHFQNQLKRTRSLIEGALTVQKLHMRTVLALTQSYAPGGKLSQYRPAWPKVDLKV